MPLVKSFEELDIWKRGRFLCREAYRISGEKPLPETSHYGINCDAQSFRSP